MNNHSHTPTQMPANPRDRMEAWKKLTFGGELFAYLRQCINRQAGDPEFQTMLAGLDVWDRKQQLVAKYEDEFSLPGYEHQSAAARVLIKLAQIAARQPKLTTDQLQQQFEAFPLTAASAWDAYCALTGKARTVLRGKKQSISVLLEQDEFGCLARLETELIADGTGQLYADPTANAFLEFEAETFLAGAREVWELVKRQFVESADQERLAAVDVRFRLIRLPVPNYRNPQLHRISGRSAQAAFFLSLFQTAGAYLGRSEALLLEDTLAASATILPSGVLGSVAALESKLTAAYLSGLAVVVVSKADEVEAQKALRDASAHDKEDKVRPLTTEVVGLGTTTELLDFLRDRAKEREAVRHYEQKKCCKLNILDREVEIEAYYQALPLLREVKKKRLPRSERKGREADEERERDDEFTTLRGMTLQRWEEALSQEQVIYQEQRYSLDELLNNFRAVVEEARSAVPRFFVLGPPGSGKTTLVQYLGWRAANRNLNVQRRQLIPVCISLHRWESFCANAKRSLPEYLAEHYQALPHPPTAQHWQSWLRRGEALLLLDGLDEVDGRAVFIEALTEALSAYTECPTIITCRTVSFEQHRKLTPDFPVFALAGLSDELRDKYIHAFPAKHLERFIPDTLIEQLKRTPQMQPLTANPLLLSIVCYVVDDPRGVSLPATRTEFYDKTVEKLLRRVRRVEGTYHRSIPLLRRFWHWLTRVRGGAVTYLSGSTALPQIRKRRILERAAFTLFVGAEQQRQLTFDEATLRDVLTEAAEQEGYRDDPAPVADALLEDLANNSGLLRGDIEHRYFFLHLTIQEYLAAGAIARIVNKSGWETVLQLSGRNITVRQLVGKKAWDPRYQEMVVLLAGQLNDPVPLLDLLVYEMEDDLFGHRLALAAQCLPETKRASTQQSPDLVSRVNQITTEVIIYWLRTKIDSISRVIPHFTRTLPVLAQVNGSVASLTNTDNPVKTTPSNSSENAQEELSLLEFIFALLHSKYSDVRSAAAFAVGEMGTAAAAPETLTALAYLLRDEVRDVRYAAANAVRALGPTAADPMVLVALAPLLQDEDSEVRSEAASAVYAMGTVAATGKILFNLASLLLNEDNSLRSAAARAFCVMGAAANVYVSALSSLLHHEDSGRRLATVRAFGEIGAVVATPEILTTLASLLRDENSEVRSEAAAVFGAMVAATATPDPEFLNILTSLLRDENSDIRSAAAQAASAMGATAANPVILSALAPLLGDENGNVRHEAASAIRSVGAAAATPEILPALTMLLRDEDGLVRMVAAMAVGEIGTAAATPENLTALFSLLRDEEFLVSHAAAESLIKMGAATAASEFLTVLASLLRDEDKEVRANASSAVGLIGAAAATREILAALASLLRDEDSHVRYMAAGAVGRMGTAAATPEILTALASLLLDGDKWVRHHAAYTVSEMGAATITREFLTALASLLHDEDELVQHMTLLAVGNMGSAAADPVILTALASLLSDGNEDAQCGAAYTVCEIGAAAATPEILATLASLLDNENQRVRSTAALAIGQLMLKGVRIFELTTGKVIGRTVADLSDLGRE